MTDEPRAFLALNGDSHGRPNSDRRPDGVTLLALLSFSSLLAVLVGTPTPLVAALGPAGIAGTLLLSLVLGAGLWELRAWAPPLAIAFYALSIIDALLLLAHGSINSQLLVGPVAIWYLRQPEIRSRFHR